MSVREAELVCDGVCVSVTLLIERRNGRVSEANRVVRKFLLAQLCRNRTDWRPWHMTPVFFFYVFSRRVPGKRRKRSKRVKAATRASISPSANTTASPVQRWAHAEREKPGHRLIACRNEGMEKEVEGTRGKVSSAQLTVNNRVVPQRRLSLSLSFSVLLQAICAKCSKTLDNKTSRVCPECFDAALSLENLGVSEQKRKTAPEVRQTKNKNTHTHIHTHTGKHLAACA